jgi:hypothetical protein
MIVSHLFKNNALRLLVPKHKSNLFNHEFDSSRDGSLLRIAILNESDELLGVIAGMGICHVFGIHGSNSSVASTY